MDGLVTGFHAAFAAGVIVAAEPIAEHEPVLDLAA
jgi:hypothetical protein